MKGGKEKRREEKKRGREKEEEEDRRETDEGRPVSREEREATTPWPEKGKKP